MKDPISIRVSVDTGLNGSNRETIILVDPEEIKGMTPKQREEYYEEKARDWLWSTINFGWSVEEPKEEEEKP